MPTDLTTLNDDELEAHKQVLDRTVERARSEMLAVQAEQDVRHHNAEAARLQAKAELEAKMRAAGEVAPSDQDVGMAAP